MSLVCTPRGGSVDVVAVGSHDGVYEGKRYFQASAPYHGAFVRLADILYVRSRRDLAYRFVSARVC